MHFAFISSASATPTPSESVSSGQTSYYDAPVMHFHTDGTTGEGLGSSSIGPHPGAPGNPSSIDQPYTEGRSAPLGHTNGEAGQRTPSLRSLPIEPDDRGKHLSAMKTTFGGTGSALGRVGSTRTTRSTHATGATSAFANGAPLTGPNAEPNVNQSLFVRGAQAERSLSQKQKSRIVKEERKESKRFSRLLKTESTTEKVALDSALRTLSALQGLHKAAIQRETKAEASYAKALSAAQKAESRFQEEKARAAELRARAEARCTEERARWEGKEGEALAQQERLDSARETVREMETRITECARNVERLRITKATDEREREAKITELVGQK